MFPLSLLGKLPEPALVLYARLQYFKGPAADSCFVYRSTLARELGWSLDKVDRNVDRLKKAGLIKTERRGQGKENLYVFLYCSLLDGAVNTASMSPQIRADESADLRLPFKEEKNTERSTTELASARATQTTGQGREGKAENKQGADEEATATAETTITVTVPAALPAEKPHVDALHEALAALAPAVRHQTTSTHRVALSPPNWQTARNCWHWAREVQPDITPAELVPYLWQRFSTYSAKVESWGILKPFVRDDSPQLRAAVVESRRQAQQQRQQQAGEEQERQLAERAAELAREEAREEARRQQLVDNPGSCECGGRGLINGQPCCRCPRGDRARMAIKAGVRIGL